MASSSSAGQCSPGGQKQAVFRERVSIDLRGYGPTLHAIAEVQHTSVAALVRTVLAEWLQTRSVIGTGIAVDAPVLAGPLSLHGPAVVTKVTLRMSVAQAAQLALQARAAELSQGTYVARLLEALAVPPVPRDLRENRATLVRSTATLAALSGDLRALARMPDRGASPTLMMLKAPAAGIAETINQHLVLAASFMAALTPCRRAGVQPNSTESKR